MVGNVLYIAFIFLEILFALGLAVYMISMVYSSVKGSPFVRTKRREALFILSKAGLKKGQVFYELGSGDGLVVRAAVSKYGVRGVGIDINPLLTKYAQFRARQQGLKNIEFRTENIFQANLLRADVVYLFLMPKLIHEFLPKLESGLKKQALVISHGFQIEPWKRHLIKTIKHDPFPTYFYRPGAK